MATHSPDGNSELVPVRRELHHRATLLPSGGSHQREVDTAPSQDPIPLAPRRHHAAVGDPQHP